MKATMPGAAKAAFHGLEAASCSAVTSAERFMTGEWYIVAKRRREGVPIAATTVSWKSGGHYDDSVYVLCM